MSAYKKSIAIFGLAVPAVATLLFCVACLVAKNKIIDKAKEKESAFAQHTSQQMQVGGLRKKTKPKKQQLEEWDAAVTDDIRPLLQETLKSVENSFTSNQFSLTSRQFSPGKPGALATGARQGSSTVQLSFRGTYLPTQQAFLKLEQQLPQLALDSITIERQRGYNDLKFNLSYTAWEKQSK